VLDAMAAGTMLVLATVLSAPSMLLLLSALQGTVDRTRLLLAGAWQFWIWAPPAGAVIYTWRDNIQCGRASTEGLLKVYYRVQLVALLLPLAVVMAVAAVFAVCKPFL